MAFRFYEKNLGHRAVNIEGLNPDNPSQYVMLSYIKPFRHHSNVGGWNEDPDMPGQSLLFGREHVYPAMISHLYSSGDVPHAVTDALAMAHKATQGNITYDSTLSDYSSHLVRHALRKGLVKENPDNPSAGVHAETDESEDYNPLFHYREPLPFRNLGSSASASNAASYIAGSGYHEIPEHKAQEAREYLRGLVSKPQPKPEEVPVQFDHPDLFDPKLRG